MLIRWATIEHAVTINKKNKWSILPCLDKSNLLLRCLSIDAAHRSPRIQTRSRQHDPSRSRRADERPTERPALWTSDDEEIPFASSSAEHSDDQPNFQPLLKPDRYPTQRRAQRDPNPGFRRERPSKTINVPFERPPLQKDPYSELALEGSTITPNERKAFENLFKLQNSKTASNSTKDGLQDPKGLDALLSASEGVVDSRGRPKPTFSSALQALAQQSQRSEDNGKTEASVVKDTSAPTSAPGPSMSEAARKDLHSVAKAVDAAETDVEIWQILQDRVFNRTAAFQLDPPPKTAPSNNSKRKRAKAAIDDTTTDAQTPASLPTNPPQTPPDHNDTILQTFPEHLTRTQSHLLKNYPSSPIPLTILPHLKHLGPATFAAGISTKLYNLHMRTLYARSNDLAAVVDTLRDMLDQKSVPTDAETLELLDDILVRARKVEDGKFGPALKAVWEMERTVTALREIAASRKSVLAGLEEKALQAVWAREMQRQRESMGDVRSESG